MTENEAISYLRQIDPKHIECVELIDMKEVWENISQAIYVVEKALKEIRQYRAIGTVEECREARERQEPMCLCDREAPFIGKSTQIQYRCPQCDIILGIGISEKPIIQEEIRHCFNCGQKLYR